MRNIALIIFLSLLTCTIAYGQINIQTLYTKEDKITKELEKAYYARIVTIPEKKSNDTIVEEFYLSNNALKLQGKVTDIFATKFKGKKYELFENGNMKSEVMYSKHSQQIDTAFYYHENGRVKSILYFPYTINKKGKYKIEEPLYLAYIDSIGNMLLRNGNGYAVSDDSDKYSYEEGNYVNHKKEGEWKGHFNGKRYTFVETFTAGKLISGVTTDSLGQQTPYDSISAGKQPEYPGGIASLMRFIGLNYNFPSEALLSGINGVVEVEFVIDKSGEPKNFKIKSDLGYGTGEAALRVAKKMKKWEPGKQRGIPVNVSYILPIRLNTVSENRTNYSR